MNTAAIAARARASAPRILAWCGQRARERSTWIGLSMLAAALGKSVLADHLTAIGDVVPMLLGGAGAIAIGATTSAQTPAQPTQLAQPSSQQPESAPTSA